jgi:hypothetical protein
VDCVVKGVFDLLYVLDCAFKGVFDLLYVLDCAFKGVFDLLYVPIALLKVCLICCMSWLEEIVT